MLVLVRPCYRRWPNLARTVGTAEIAFAAQTIPILLDWRLRECDFGERTGEAGEAHQRDRVAHLDVPCPGGKSWRQATTRVARFLYDVVWRWDETRVLVIGHVATRWAFDRDLDAVPLEHLVGAEFEWRPGCEYRLHHASQVDVQRSARSGPARD